MNRSNKYRLIAAAVAALLFAGMLLWLLFTRLQYVPDDGSQWPPAPDTTAILLADEYVEVLPVVPELPGGDEDEGATSLPPEALDLIDAGTPAEAPADLASSDQKSPVTAPKPKPKKDVGPQKSTTPDAKPKETPKRDVQREAGSRWNKGSQAGADGSGSASKGSGEGAGKSKGRHSGSGRGNLSGRTVSVNSDGINAPNAGKVVVTITVNPKGEVLYVELKNSGGYDSSVTDECVRRARAARVSADPGAAPRQSGDITFSFI